MKRSEMIAIIAREIGGLINPSSETLICEKLLSKIESAGMTPPERKNPNYSGGWQDTYSNIRPTLTGWEPEN